MDDARVFRCARCQCQVRVCSRCDRGQRYCGARCTGAARAESVRVAGRRYQRTRRGRVAHAWRQHRYRERLHRYREHRAGVHKVTHQGSRAWRGVVSIALQPVNRREDAMSRHDSAIDEPRCDFCARAVRAVMRVGWVRTRIDGPWLG